MGHLVRSWTDVAYTVPDAIANDDLWFGCQEIELPSEAECLAAMEMINDKSGVVTFSAAHESHMKLVALAIAMRLYKRQSFTFVDMSNPEPHFVNDMSPPEVLLSSNSDFSHRPISKAVSRVRTTGFLVVLNVDIIADEDAIILTEAIKRRAINTRGSMSFLTVFTSVKQVCPQLRSLVCKSSSQT